MTLKQAEALPELRWIDRPYLRRNSRTGEMITTGASHLVLQQRWRVPRDPTPESLSATALEWRDVPVVEEEREA